MVNVHANGGGMHDGALVAQLSYANGIAADNVVVLTAIKTPSSTVVVEAKQRWRVSVRLVV